MTSVCNLTHFSEPPKRRTLSRDPGLRVRATFCSRWQFTPRSHWTLIVLGFTDFLTSRLTPRKGCFSIFLAETAFSSRCHNWHNFLYDDRKETDLYSCVGINWYFRDQIVSYELAFRPCIYQFQLGIFLFTNSIPSRLSYNCCSFSLKRGDSHCSGDQPILDQRS